MLNINRTTSADSAAQARRTGALAGLLFVTLSIVGIATIGHYPKPHEAAGVYVQYFHDHRSAILLTNALLSLANGALIVYFGYLRVAVGERDSGSPLPTIAFGGCILLCALGASGAMLTAGLAFFGTAGIPASIVKLTQNLYYAMNAFSAMPAALAVGSVALFAAIQRQPRWIVIFSGAIATVELAATFALEGSGDFFSPAGTFGAPILYGSLTVWVLVMSVRWLRTPGLRTTRSPAPAA